MKAFAEKKLPPLINLDADTIRCVAGPGSGKTFGLCDVLSASCIPKAWCRRPQVLVVAFNRVIARQLREDIQARLNTFDCEHEPVIRTIHALCIDVIAEELRTLLPHEVDAMIYDVRQEYPSVAALYENFRKTSKRFAITKPATLIIYLCGKLSENGSCATRLIWSATFLGSSLSD